MPSWNSQSGSALDLSALGKGPARALPRRTDRLDLSPSVSPAPAGRRRLLSAVLAILFCLPSPASAARFLQLVIAQEGVTVLRAAYDSPDRAPTANAWRELQKPPIFGADTDSTRITPNPQDPTRAVLKGDITVTLLHVDRLLAQAKVNRLELTRPDAQSLAWHLTGPEVERTAQLAGLPKPSLYLNRTVIGLTVVALLLLGFLLAVAFVGWRLRRMLRS